MDSKTFRDLTKSTNKKRIQKLALRCALQLELDAESQEDALVSKLINLRDPQMSEEELNSQEMNTLIEAVSGEDRKSLSKYLPAQTLEVGYIVYGSRSYVNAARVAILVCLALNQNDVSFFLNKKLLKYGVQEALKAEAEADADEEAAPGSEEEAPTPPKETVSEKKERADEVLSKIRSLLV